MSDPKVEAGLKDLARTVADLDRRLGDTQSDISVLRSELKAEAQQRHADIVSAVRQERGATAETVRAGVNEARDTAVSDASVRVEEVRDEIRDVLAKAGEALQG